MPTFDEDPLTAAESERLRVTLGSIGDQVVAPAKFTRRRLDRSDLHPRRYRAALAGTAAACVFVALIVWGASGRSAGHVVEPDEVPSSVPKVDGPWYVIKRANVEGDSVAASTSPKDDVRVWMSDDVSHVQVLSVHTLSVEDPTTVFGTLSQQIGPVSGTLDLIAGPGDIPDPQTVVGCRQQLFAVARIADGLDQAGIVFQHHGTAARGGPEANAAIR